MADVFLSYRRDDRPRAEALARALKEEALEVWWDAGLQAGEAFDKTIQTTLEAAKAVIVLWSPSAVQSEWVRSESSIGRERGVLVPVMVHSCVIPVPFNLLHTVDLTHWSGDRADPAYQGVVKRLKELAGKKNVAPLKPPPNRQMRSLWQAILAIAVLAAIGSSLWVFRPWEAVIAANDPAVKAKAAREASLKALAAYGLQPDDFAHYDWKEIAEKRFRRESYPDLIRAADAGDTAAQALMCTVAYYGTGDGPKDPIKAEAYCRKSADGGDPVGQVYYGYVLKLRDEAEAATNQFKKASDQGFVWGQFEYGYRLQKGDGVPRDPVHASELYQVAQAQGFLPAQYALGMYYAQGLAGEPDPAKALALVKEAAEKDFPPAIYQMGEWTRQGYGGLKKDLPAAKALYEKAASYPDYVEVAERAKGAIKFVEDDMKDAADAQAGSPATGPSPASPAKN